MDYRLNNESIVACVISQIIYRSLSSQNDIARIALLTSLLFNDHSIGLLHNSENLKAKTDQIESYISFTSSFVYKEMLPIVINSVVLLLQGGILQKSNDENLIITEKGLVFCTGMYEISLGSRCSEILYQIDKVLDVCSKYSTVELYDKFKIII